MKIRKSRLSQKEEARSLRRAFLFGLLTLILSLGLIFLGIPTLIKMAVFIGNIKSTYTPVENQDTLPPAPPRLKPLPEATSSAQINIQGFAESGSTVEIFLDATKVKEVVAENDNSFLSQVELGLGRNDIYAVAIDQDGNQSQASGMMAIIYDDEPPELSLIQPEGLKFSTDQEKITIQGEINEEATVVINDRLVIVDAQNQFEHPFTLSTGENKILILVTDKAGSEVETELIVTRE